MIEIASLYPNALGAELSQLRAVRDAGYDAVQLHPRAFAEPDGLSEQTPLGPVLEAVRSVGLRIAGWSGYRPLIGDPATVTDNVAYLAAVLRLAGRAAVVDPELAVPIVCTETGAPDPERADEQEWQQLVASFKALTSVAETVGARIAIEATRSHIVRDVETTLRVIEDVGSEALGVCYDPANIIQKGEPVRASFEPLKESIFLSHAKDVRFAQDGSVEAYPPAGEGDIDYQEFVDLISRLPGRHVLAVEYARSEEKLIQVARFLDGLRQADSR